MISLILSQEEEAVSPVKSVLASFGTQVSSDNNRSTQQNHSFSVCLKILCKDCPEAERKNCVKLYLLDSAISDRRRCKVVNPIRRWKESPHHAGPQNNLSNSELLISPVRVFPILKPLQIKRNGTLHKTRPGKGESPRPYGRTTQLEFHSLGRTSKLNEETSHNL